ncbi:hypothetical protein Tsp_10307 [Trichinella spiralis]|uniref:hypothetical protein n=1 Tax=Trichinella spiralis TaxID=6334 RepID=UPI0001EFE1D4|nr:hypothetical protein Tsp_10307 [Trichinella spiralis]
MRDGVGLGKIYYLLNSVGIDLAVNIALLWPSWLAVGDATAHAEQAESSATTTTITITITISTTNISGCKQTYVVEIEKFDFFRRPAAFGTRTPFVWLRVEFVSCLKEEEWKIDFASSYYYYHYCCGCCIQERFSL